MICRSLCLILGGGVLSTKILNVDLLLGVRVDVDWLEVNLYLNTLPPGFLEFISVGLTMLDL